MSHPTPSDDTMTVYGFSYYDFSRRESEVALYKATRDAILAAKGIVLMGTKEQVPTSALNERGEYRRVATGWGALA